MLYKAHQASKWMIGTALGWSRWYSFIHQTSIWVPAIYLFFMQYFQLNSSDTYSAMYIFFNVN